MPPRASYLNGFGDFCTKNGSSRGQNLALTGVFIQSSLCCTGTPSRTSARRTRSLSGCNRQDLAILWDPLSSEVGINTSVKARLWHRLEPYSVQTSLNSFKSFQLRGIGRVQGRGRVREEQDISLVTLWVHSGHNLDTLWAHFGYTLGTLWAHFGHTVGTLWAHFGHTLVSSPTRLTLGTLSVPLWSHSGYTRVTLGSHVGHTLVMNWSHSVHTLSTLGLH